VARYAYKGRDASGALVEGVLEATDSTAVAGRLLDTGVTPVEIGPRAAGGLTFAALVKRSRAPARDDVLLFSRQMYTLLKAGVPIMGALKGLQESTESAPFVEVLQEVRASLDQGRDLAASLARHPRAFSDFYVSMVRVGEYTGRLEAAFLRLFHHLDFERFMREQVRAALRYPTFVVAAMAVALVIINIFVVPAFEKIFAGFRAELPLATRVMIAFSRATVRYWPYAAGALAAGGFGFRAWIAMPAGRMAWDTWKLRIPIAGAIVLKATLARFARSLSIALASGVPAVQALATVAATVDNRYVASRIEGMRVAVERGESILRAGTAAGFFNPMVLQMIAVGEESGALDDMMAEVADMYQRDVEYALKTLGAQLEPLLIIFLGVLVLLLALGVFLPLWDLGSVALGRRA
jgi:MSHA biogenesis protein MshG